MLSPPRPPSVPLRLNHLNKEKRRRRSTIAMEDLASTCKDKLAYFRIKELKDVLTHLSLPKQGKKQELVDRVLALLSDDHGQWRLGWGKENVSSKEAVAKIVDDIYSQRGPDFNRIKPKKEADDSCQLDTNVRCLCGQTFLLGNLVKCDDHRCQVQQHMGCVLIPENPTEGVRPEVPSHFYCQLCRLSRADPYAFLQSTWFSISSYTFSSREIRCSTVTLKRSDCS